MMFKYYLTNIHQHEQQFSPVYLFGMVYSLKDTAPSGRKWLMLGVINRRDILLSSVR